MSIINTNEIKQNVSEDQSIISLKSLIDKIPHAPSRNERRSSFFNTLNQYSTKEGTPNKPVNSKTLDFIRDDEISNSISSQQLANMTNIFDKERFEKMTIKKEEKRNTNFVYDMLRANNIKKKISDNIKISNESIKKSKIKKSSISSTNNTTKRSTKERISCCFCFK